VIVEGAYSRSIEAEVGGEERQVLQVHQVGTRKADHAFDERFVGPVTLLSQGPEGQVVHDPGDVRPVLQQAVLAVPGSPRGRQHVAVPATGA
jgi:hypothetical protein